MTSSITRCAQNTKVKKLGPVTLRASEVKLGFSDLSKTHVQSLKKVLPTFSICDQNLMPVYLIIDNTAFVISVD